MVSLSSFLSLACPLSPAQPPCPVGPALTPLHLSPEGREQRRTCEKLLGRSCLDGMEAESGLHPGRRPGPRRSWAEGWAGSPVTGVTGPQLCWAQLWEAEPGGRSHGRDQALEVAFG